MGNEFVDITIGIDPDYFKKHVLPDDSDFHSRTPYRYGDYLLTPYRYGDYLAMRLKNTFRTHFIEAHVTTEYTTEQSGPNAYGQSVIQCDYKNQTRARAIVDNVLANAWQDFVYGDPEHQSEKLDHELKITAQHADKIYVLDGIRHNRTDWKQVPNVIRDSLPALVNRARDHVVSDLESSGNPPNDQTSTLGIYYQAIDRADQTSEAGFVTVSLTPADFSEPQSDPDKVVDINERLGMLSASDF